MKYIFFAAAFLLVLFTSCEKYFFESPLSRVIYSINNTSKDTLFVSSYIYYTDKDEVYCYMNQHYKILYPNDSIEASFHSKKGVDYSWSKFFNQEEIDSVLIVLSSTPLKYLVGHYYENVLQDSSIVKVFYYNRDMAEKLESIRFVYP